MRSRVMRDIFCLLRQGNMCTHVAECRETVSVQTVVNARCLRRAGQPRWQQPQQAVTPCTVAAAAAL